VLEEKRERLKKRYAEQLIQEVVASKAKARAVKSGNGFSLRRSYTGTIAKMLTKVTKRGKVAVKIMSS
ncbi:hypothetical protein A2U01_0066470, partial [Trifolium medium]|nr:hypothetical protein [Trifolium medium]